MTVAEARGFLDDGTFSDGMIPKMRAAIEAVSGGARRAVIAEAVRDGIGAALAGGRDGTRPVVTIGPRPARQTLVA